jgi:hypothetical protein
MYKFNRGVLVFCVTNGKNKFATSSAEHAHQKDKNKIATILVLVSLIKSINCGCLRKIN